MTAEIKNPKLQFWLKWALFSLGIIPVSYLLSLIIVLLVHGAFGFTMTEGGTYLSQTLMQIAGGAMIGWGTGMYQRQLLKEIFKVSSSWVYTLVIGFAVTELIVCIALWQLGMNRYELRWIELRPLPEALIFALIGLTVGLLQWMILRRFFIRSIYWVLASSLGWGACVLMTIFQGWVIVAFCLGTFIYGLITGATLMWILERKDETS
jgi:hypothetical protein